MLRDLSPTKPPAVIEPLDADAVLRHAGDFHRFQYILIALFALINTLSAFHYFGQTFASLVPTYACAWNDSTTALLGDGAGSGDECSRSVRLPTGELATEWCDRWMYNGSYGFVSIVQDLNWICEDDWKPALGQSVFFLGSVLASIVFGVLADRIGRLHTLVLANMCACAGNILTAISGDAAQYSAYRFLAGCATDTNFIMMYIIVMEYIRPGMRTMGLNLTIGIFYCLSSIAVPWIAVLTRHWTYFMLAIGIPHIGILLFYLCVPESAQWLLSTGRTDRAVACYERIGRSNGRPLAPNVGLGLREYARQHVTGNEVSEQGVERSQYENFFGLLKTPHLRRKTLILIFKSMVMTLCYDAIARNVNELPYSPFVVFTVTSATILPACTLVVAVQDRIGRKALASGSLFLSGVFMILTAFILMGMNSAPLTLAATVLARLSVVVAYNSGHQYAVELIPVQVRGQGISVIHVAGFVASFFSPQILYLGGIWKPAPDFILGTLLVLGACACLFLPETLNRKLPVTLEDGEHFGRGEGIFEHILYKSKISESTIYILGSSQHQLSK